MIPTSWQTPSVPLTKDLVHRRSTDSSGTGASGAVPPPHTPVRPTPSTIAVSQVPQSPETKKSPRRSPTAAQAEAPASSLPKPAAPRPVPGRQEWGRGLDIGLEDRAILRRLAEQVAVAASSPHMQQTRDLWRRHNQLEKTRPLVFCDPEQGWSEILTAAEFQCRAPLARRWEMALRREYFWAYAMGDDKPVGPYFDIPIILRKEDWGLETGFHRTAQRGSYAWESPLKDYRKDLKRLHTPQLEVDLNGSQALLQLARDLFGDLLCVRLAGVWWWSLGLTMRAVHLRGLEQLHYDFVDHPDEVKELMSILSRGTMQKLDFLEANDLLTLNNEGTYVGSGGFGYTDELPQPDFAGRARCCDLWGFADSQETSQVSPRMYAEFVFPYEKPILDRFGLNCYGCCEPLHGRWSQVAEHSNLRRVSCSPWADVRKMAAALEDRYILSIKPNPAALATPNIDRQAIRRWLRETLDATRDCIVEIIMKDNHTLGGNPDNAVQWCRIAKEEAQRLAD